MIHYAKIEAAIRQGTAADWVPRWVLEWLRISQGAGAT